MVVMWSIFVQPLKTLTGLDQGRIQIPFFTFYVVFPAVAIVAGMLFLISIAGHFYVKLRLRPDDSELDDYYHEFEDQAPGYAEYDKWLRITSIGVAVSMLLLFVAAMI